jgi:Helicase conserved C-terminal domain
MNTLTLPFSLPPSLPNTHHTLSQAFKDGQVQFLICTDLAARGIDVKGLPYVINMTLPDETDTYFHRIGTIPMTFPFT